MWGWKHEVEPGKFSDDQRQSIESLGHLEGLARRHPKMAVRFGHQLL
ncbi:MAG TPA: hypothetical protein VHU80_20270 [Polyangiaceae bacterium]|nr:hypothetical protein [Polyangiaceae bacterium]